MSARWKSYKKALIKCYPDIKFNFTKFGTYNTPLLQPTITTTHHYYNTITNTITTTQYYYNTIQHHKLNKYTAKYNSSLQTHTTILHKHRNYTQLHKHNPIFFYSTIKD